MRLAVYTGADATLAPASGTDLALSPDGTRIVFRARGSDQEVRLYARTLGQLGAIPLPSTERAFDPFFSDDGQWVGFFVENRLKKVPFQGGEAVTICDAPNSRGGTWSRDGNIIFGELGSGLSIVSSSGGAPRTLTALDSQKGEITHRWPQVLPDGKTVLFTSHVHVGTFEDADIDAYSLTSGQRKHILHGGYDARYLLSGHLVYMHLGKLFAVPFDAKRLEADGQPVPILDGIASNLATGGAQFSSSDSGSLAYLQAGPFGGDVSISWMNADGKTQPMRKQLAIYYSPVFSPNGQRLAIEIWDPGGRVDIWLYEWTTDNLTRLTFSGEANLHPVWSPDGKRIIYESRERGGQLNIYWKQADGSGEEQRITESKNEQRLPTWHPDGKSLAFVEITPGGYAIMVMPVSGNDQSGWKFGAPQHFLQSSSMLWAPAFSPDGRWLAYISDESGTSELYVKPFPGSAGRWLASIS